MPWGRPQSSNNDPLKRIDEGKCGIENQELLEKSREDVLYVDDGSQPHPHLKKDAEPLTDVAEEHIQASQHQPKPEAKGLKQEDNPRHGQPGRGDGCLENGGEEKEKYHRNTDAQGSSHGTLGDEDLFGDGKFLEVGGIFQEGLGSSGDALRKSQPGEQSGAKVNRKSFCRTCTGQSNFHDLRKDDGQNQDLQERNQDIPKNAHGGTRIAVPKVADRRAPDKQSIDPKDPKRVSHDQSIHGLGKHPISIAPLSQLQDGNVPGADRNNMRLRKKCRWYKFLTSLLLEGSEPNEP